MFFCASMFIGGEPVEPFVKNRNPQQENEVLQQRQPISSFLICGIMSQFVMFVRSNQVSIAGSFWDGFCSGAMPDARIPEEKEITRAVDAHLLMDQPAPTTTDAAPEGQEAVTIVGGGGTGVDFSPEVSAGAAEKPGESAGAAEEPKESPPVKVNRLSQR